MLRLALEIIGPAEENRLVPIMNVTRGAKIHAGASSGRWWDVRALKTNTEQFAVDISH